MYSYIHNETTMMMLGLIVLSWLKSILRKNGEWILSHNPTHRLTATIKPSNCPVGW
ncbi:MAG TPA: hypothetical protein VFY41_09925 [Nitrososphaeraceae archaeon]|nr:hypothetical protein [Nitrososphaeraceae archaeon]